MASSGVSRALWEQSEDFRRKVGYAKALMSHSPSLWFGDSDLHPRLASLINAPPLDFIDYTLEARSPFLRSITYQKLDEENSFTEVQWTRPNHDLCEQAFFRGGGLGYNPNQPLDDEAVMRDGKKLKIHTWIHPASGLPCQSGILSSPPNRAQIARGPSQTCQQHPWDAMVIYDCEVTSAELGEVARVASQRWDLLLFKICSTGIEYPWVVVAMKASPTF
ncbi:hypothetical protein GGR53DRAFT_530627 [Hypoxylon sp. FL1150]|nr:hypothetical protein GGR53DRAFT_530627 [Hypoxylon sp. FL1150]